MANITVTASWVGNVFDTADPLIVPTPSADIIDIIVASAITGGYIESGRGGDTITIDGDVSLEYIITDGLTTEVDNISLSNGVTIETILTGNGADIVTIDTVTFSSAGATGITTGEGADAIALANTGVDFIDTGTEFDALNMVASSISNTLDMGSGNDTLTMGIDDGVDTSVDASKIGGTINMGSGTDRIFMYDGSFIVADIDTGSGSDRIELYDGSSITGTTIEFGTGNDRLVVRDDSTVSANITGGIGTDRFDFEDTSSTTGSIDTGDGNDTIYIENSATIDNDISMGGDADFLELTDSTSVDGDIFMGDGDDTVTIDSSSGISGNVDGEAGNDSIYVGGGTTVKGSVLGGDGNDTIELDGGIHGGAVYGDTADSIPTADKGSDTFIITSATTVAIDGEESTGDTDTDVLDLSGVISDITSWTPDALDAESGTVVFSGGETIKYTNIENVVYCFANGTEIATTKGTVKVEDLNVGDLVQTVDQGLQPLRWIGVRTMKKANFDESPHLRPIRICQGALGHGLPLKDLVVSPQHRMLVRSAIAKRMFDQAEVLAAAKHLIEIPGIEVAEDIDDVVYYHLAFDQHQLVWANGAMSESLYVGPEVVKSVHEDGMRELFELFPELTETNEDGESKMQPARQLISGRLAKKLAFRHTKNSRALFMYEEPNTHVTQTTADP